MKKILVTGINPRQAGSQRCPMKYATGIEALVKTARTLGYEVDWRPVQIGETLQEYSKVVAYIAPPCGMSAMHIYSFLWTLFVRADAMIGADDWQMAAIHKSFKQLAQEPFKGLWGRLPRPQEDEAASSEYHDKILHTVDSLAKDKWDRTLVAPIMEGGDPAKLNLPVNRFAPFDPSPFWVEEYKGIVPETQNTTRLERWVFASLLRKDKWLANLGTSWHIEYYGNRSLKQPRIDERDLLKVYAMSSGVLSPSHDLIGCGWWRARYVLAYLAQTALAGDPRELSVLGSSYEHSPKDVEGMGYPAYLQLAQAQRSDFQDIMWSSDKLNAYVQELFQ